MGTAASGLRAPLVPQALGIVALFNLAVAHPVYQVLAAAPEFFVARRVSPADVWLLAALLSFVLPAGIVVVAWTAGRLSKRAGAAVLALTVGLLCAALALQALEQLGASRALAAIAGAGLAGAGALAAYARVAGFRTFVALLGPAVLAVPILFLARPSVRVFAFSHEAPIVQSAGPALKDAPPLVLIVFDQLPLVSLLDGDGRIDRALYPAFAALADEATWFRNATAVAASTGSALPPIVTGVHPRPNAPPMAAAHTTSLFTLLGGTYRMNVVEPITSLCPESLCPPASDSPATRLAALCLDAAVVYLHVLAPRELDGALPPVDQNWKNFAADQDWHARWLEQQDTDRRQGPERFIQAIQAEGDRPAFHFLHVLLPHEPYVYARTGQAFAKGTALPGLARGWQWGTDEWLVTQNYQAHLVQVGYVDALLGRIVDRLKSAGLYDRAVFVVTADHGASFQPGRAFKELNGDTAADIMAVPLFVKTPGQRAGAISDRNVETLDIAPTIAGVLGAALPWTPDGTPALDPATPPRPDKVAFVGTARHVVRHPEVFHQGVRASVARKLALFRDGNPHAPLRAPHPDLVGHAVADLRTGERWPGPVVLDDAYVFASLDAAADFVPARLSGHAYGAEEAEERVALAVAVNDRVRATTFTAEGGSMWSALLPLDAFRSGRNDVRVFVIDGDGSGPVLRSAVETRRPAELDLVSGHAKHMWGVQQSGLYAREFRGAQPFYWTDGAARLVTPLDPAARPTALKIDVAMTGPQGADLRVLVDGCEVFRGSISGAWSRTLPLAACTPHADRTTIEVLSDTFSPGAGDARRLGVALDAVILLTASPP